MASIQPADRPTVTVYGRPGCHLCEDALAAIDRVRREAVFELDVVDIEQDDKLLLRYLERIPVVAIDGHELFELFVDEAALTEAIRHPSVL
jgi:glutaredoxin